MEGYPKFEKVDDNVIRIISEKIDEVPLTKVLETKKVVEEKIAQLRATLDNLNEIIENAANLGIHTPNEPEKAKE